MLRRYTITLIHKLDVQNQAIIHWYHTATDFPGPRLLLEQEFATHRINPSYYQPTGYIQLHDCYRLGFLTFYYLSIFTYARSMEYGNNHA